jgi:choline-sulfatase
MNAGPSRRRATLFGLATAAICLVSCQADDPPLAARNVLLITIDTLRADRLGGFGYPLETSPAIDALAERSVVFENAQVQSAWTLPSLASLMTSLHTSTHGAWSFDSRLDESFTTLAEQLRGAGYATFGVASHVFLDDRYGLQQGFEAFDTELVTDFVASHEAITSPQVSERGIRWLEERAQHESPWLLWVHYFDPHATYREHPGVSERFGTLSDSQRYDGEIAFTDRSIGLLLDRLSELGLAEDTIVVLVADHGEEFGEHGGDGHGRTLHREVVHVPLIIHAPGLTPKRISRRVSSVDVLPTLLELLGLPPPHPSAGRSLLAAMRGEELADEPVLAELGLNPGNPIDSLSLGGWKLMRQRKTGRTLLFDLVLDPGELEDLASQRPERVAELLARLDRAVAEAEALAGEFVRAGPLQLSDEEIERLRALGYVDGP